MQYFKPNFKSHPLNYFFVLLVFLGAFAFSSMALAEEDDGTNTASYYWKHSFAWGTTYGKTATQSCQSHWDKYATGGMTGFVTRNNDTSYNCAIRRTDGSVWYISGAYTTRYSCGSSTAWYCEPLEPVNNCPEYGAVERISKVINGTVVDGVFVPRPDDAVLTLEIGGGASKDGCGYAVPAGANIPAGFTANVDVRCAPSGIAGKPICTRFENMISTGDLTEPAAGAPSTGLPTDQTEDDYEKTLLETASDKVVGDVTVTDMAGTSSTTQTITETLVKDKGAVVVDSQETAVITESNGIYRTVTTTVNTLDFPDGTQQVITETNTAYTQTPKTVFNIDKSTGTTNITVQGGSSADYSVTETKDFDSQGNETGSKTETEGSGEGDAEEEKEAQECEADPEKCKETEFAKTEKGSFDLAAAATAMGDAEGEYKEYLEIVKGEVQEKIGIQFSGGSGSIDSNVINVRGATGDIGLTKWIPFLDDFGLAALILFLAAMYSAYILLGGNRD